MDWKASLEMSIKSNWKWQGSHMPISECKSDTIEGKSQVRFGRKWPKPSLFPITLNGSSPKNVTEQKETASRGCSNFQPLQPLTDTELPRALCWQPSHAGGHTPSPNKASAGTTPSMFLLCFESQQTQAARPSCTSWGTAPSLPEFCCWEICLWFPKLGSEHPGAHWPPFVDNDIKLVGWSELLSGGRVVRRESFHGNIWDIKGLGRAKKVPTILSLFPNRKKAAQAPGLPSDAAE